MTAEPAPILSFPTGLEADASHHLIRAELTSRRPRSLHGHSFYEMLWVQNGIVRHHLPQGRTDLVEGDVVFVRPGDAHGLQGRGEAAMIVSLSIRANRIETLRTRHPQLAGRAFWATGPDPDSIHLGVRELGELNHAALRLERAPRSPLALEAFLLPVMSDLAEAPTDVPSDAPAWLHRVCAAGRDPAVFRDGAAGLARVAGRAHPHVARTMRRFLDMTPSDYANAQRMRHAARRLIATEDSLAEIAEDCGIPNLSHFHKLFLAHHGETPQRYRRARRTGLIQP